MAKNKQDKETPKNTIPRFDPHEQSVLKMSFMTHDEQKNFLKTRKEKKVLEKFKK
jgi:hypothetical protein